MSQKQFIAYAEIKNKDKVIIVDGRHVKGLVLSHWKGANRLSQIAADTSAEIVLNAIALNYPGLEYPIVTATHFDIDGFIGVWALFYPQLAQQYDPLLREIARIGDFRHFNPKSPYALNALKAVCWLNALEQQHFYRPYDSNQEIDDCVSKFLYFLPKFADFLLNPNAQSKIWEQEYQRVLSDIELMNKAKLRHFPHLGLQIIETPQPLHYYALMSKSSDFDIILSLYDNRRYELEYKYTTWVDIVSRNTLPRLPLDPLLAELQEEEQSGLCWNVDKITDTGPILRLEKEPLLKADRFANPYQREIYASSIEQESMVQKVLAFFSKGYS